MTGRSTAIVLFTDLVGSTELRARLGEEAAETLRRQHDAVVRSAVAANGGKVVKNLGDGFMATFAGAADGVSGAMDIQQAIARHNRGRRDSLGIRIGISAGDVVFEADDCFGTPVIEAARLCAAARGGQILASEIVRWMARSGGVTFVPAGDLELKGLPEPVPAVEVMWEPPPEAPLPLPPFLTDIGRIFVGRDRELDRLGQLWKEAAAGELRVGLLAGEPGVGKTRLAAELAVRVHDEGAIVLAGRCDEDLGVPYQPFVEALRHFAEHAPDLAERLGRYGGELARLVPELSERVPGLPTPLRSDPGTERYRLFDAVAAWLDAAAEQVPVLLVLDDIQWAAKPTLLLVRHVVRSGLAARILVLGTYRDVELTHGHPLLEVIADLRRQGGVDRLSLTGLDDVGVAALVEQAAGQPLDEAGLALARAVYEETEGNPFFVREVLRHLAETGAIERREGSWTTRLPVEELGIPEGIRDVVGRRLTRLSTDTHRALRVAAVVGSEFELGVVGAAGGISEAAVLDAVEEATAARLVSEVSATRYRFSHALVRATLYDSITAARRVSLHRRTAEAMETIHEGALDDFLPALAHHWAKAAAPVTDIERAVEYARRAGDRARRVLAHDEAANYYASGLELLDEAGCGPDDPRRLELLIGLGEAQRGAGHGGYRQTLLDAARLAERLGDARALARAALANTLGFMWSTAFVVDTERVEILERALAAIGDDDPALRARLLATLALELAWQPDPARRLAMSAEALQIARSLSDPGTLAEVLLARDYTITAPDNVAERLEATTELLAIAEEVGNPVLASRALSLRFKAAMEMADIVVAEQSVARNSALIADLGQPGLTWAVRHHETTLLILRADPGAEAAMVAAGELGGGIGNTDIFLAAHRYSLTRELDRVGELEPWMRAVAERAGSPYVKSMHAHILAEIGETGTARRYFDEIAATGFYHPTNTVAWLAFMAVCAWLTARFGRKDAVPFLRSTLEPYSDQFVIGAFGGWLAGSVSLYLGLLCQTTEDWDAAETYFAKAEATHERMGAVTWLARTRVEWAAMLLDRAAPRDRERAEELLRMALATARERNLVKLERDAAEALQRV
jgi:class 3 adenylate cyclase